jgi:hypothetical protein
LELRYEDEPNYALIGRVLNKIVSDSSGCKRTTLPPFDWESSGAFHHCFNDAKSEGDNLDSARSPSSLTDSTASSETEYTTCTSEADNSITDSTADSEANNSTYLSTTWEELESNGFFDEVSWFVTFRIL